MEVIPEVEVIAEPVDVVAVAVGAPAEDEKDSVRLIVMGDSISDFNGSADVQSLYPNSNVADESQMWYSLLDGRLPWNTEAMDVWARSGIGYSESTNGPTGFWVWNAFVGQTPPDVILLALGADDGLTDPETLETSVVKTLDTLDKLWPEAQVILVIPPESDYNGIADAEGARTAFNAAWDSADEAASELNVPVIDLRECVVSRYASLYTLDGRHPNAAGMKAIADYIVNQLK